MNDTRTANDPFTKEDLREMVADSHAAHMIASQAADDFRDALCEVLGYTRGPDGNNPGDAALIAELLHRYAR